MTAAATSGGRSGRSGRSVLLVVAMVLLLAGVVALRGSGAGTPYDLDDAGPQGYKGLRLALEWLGARIDRIDADQLDAAMVTRVPVAFVPVASGASPAMTRR